MKNSLLNTLLLFILILVAVIVLFNINIYLGILVTILALSYFLYRSRASIYVLQGNAKYSSGDLEKALEYYKKAYGTGKCKPQTIISYAYLLLRSGKLDESEKLLTEVLNTSLDADSKMLAKSNMSLVLWKKNRLDDATALLEEVFADYKTTVMYGNLGYMYVLKGDMEKALEFNLEAYGYNDTNPVILDNLGQTYYLRGEYDKSEEIYSKLMASNPKTPGVYYNYGLLLSALGQDEKALEVLRKALDFKINFLSGVTEEEIRNKMQKIEEGLVS